MRYILALLLSAICLQAGEITFALTNHYSTALPSNTVAYVSLVETNNPNVNGGWLVVGNPRRLALPYGLGSTNLSPGAYKLEVDGLKWAAPLYFTVGTNASYTLAECIGTNAPTVFGSPPWVYDILSGDTSTATVTSNAGVYTLTVTGGGGSTNGQTAVQVTNIVNAQIALSNALVRAEIYSASNSAYAAAVAAPFVTQITSSNGSVDFTPETGKGTVDLKVSTIWSNAVWSGSRSNLVNAINVRDYGAVGDGVTDDTAAIASAFAVFNDPTNYLNLYFPRGRYRDLGTHYVTKASTDTPYHSRGDRTIFGEGSLSLVKIEATTGAWISVTNGMFNIRDMILYGPGPTVGAMSGIAMFGVDSYPTIERITVYNMSRYGVYFEGHRSATINDTWLHQCWVGLGVGLACDGLTFKGRLSGNSVGIEMGAMPYNVIADSPVIAGSQGNGCRFDVVGGYNNDVMLIADGGGTLQLTLSGRIEDSRTVLMVGHQDRSVWTPATVVDSATLRTPAVGYSYAVLTGPVTVEGFYNVQNARTNITAAIEVYRPVHLVIRNSVLKTSTGKSTLYLASAAAASRINIQDSGWITLTNSTTNFEWGNNMRSVGTRDWLRANPQNLSDTAGINPGMSIFQDATTLYGLTLAKNTNSARWRMMSIAPNTADFGWGFFATGLPTGNTNWYETLSLRGDNGGRIGIRTAAPAYTLDVGGDIRATNAIYANGFFGGKVKANPDNSASQTAMNPSMSIFEDANALYGWQLGRNAGRSTWVLQGVIPASGDWEVATHAAGTYPAGQTSLTPRLHVNGANGYVGVCKSNPVAPLDVEGTVLATEVNVKGSLSVGGAVNSTNGFHGSGIGITNIPLTGVNGLPAALAWLTNNTGSSTGAVSSVNGLTGAVVLGAADVGAQPASVNGTNWAAISTNIITDLRQEIADTTLDFVPQYGTANLTNWAAVDPADWRESKATKTLVVDVENGNDTTGLRGREDRSFASVAAASAASAPGDVIMIRPGSNYVSSSVWLKTNVTVRGFGAASRIYGDAAQTNQAVLAVTNSGVTIEDLWVSAAGTAIGYIGGVGNLAYATNVTLRNVHADGGTYGVAWAGDYLDTGEDHSVTVLMESCAVYGAGVIGVRFHGHTNIASVRMNNCSVTGNIDAVILGGCVAVIEGGRYVSEIDGITTGHHADVTVRGAYVRGLGSSSNADLFNDGYPNSILREDGVDYITPGVDEDYDKLVHVVRQKIQAGEVRTGSLVVTNGINATNLTGTIDAARLPPSVTNSIVGGINLSNPAANAIYMLSITEPTTLSAFGNMHASEFRTAQLWVTNGAGSNCTVTLPAGTSCPDGNPLYVTNGQRRVVSVGGIINFTNAISRWLP